MTNFNKFRELTSGLDAPSLFLDAAWLFAVSAALERRVYSGSIHRRLHANNFFMLIGPAGVGKGLALREAKRLLNAYSLYTPDELKKPAAERRPLIDPVTHAEKKLFYALPDATTFESVVREIAEAKKQYAVAEGKLETTCAAYFCLEELSSLLRPRKSEEVARFLLNMYDGEPYTYRTATSGSAYIESGCLNVMAGTTPDFLKTAEESGIIGEGLLSRFVVISVTRSDREPRFFLPELTTEQIAIQAHLQKWLAFLGTIYGKVELEPGVADDLEAWWKGEVKRLAAYGDEKIEKAFARRKVQVIKLAKAFHFSESAKMLVPFRPFRQAIDYLTSLEPDVVKLIHNTGRNAGYSVQVRFISWLKLQSPQALGEVVQRLAPELDYQGIYNLLQLCAQSNEVLQEGDLVFALDENKQKITNNTDYRPQVMMPTREIKDE